MTTRKNFKRRVRARAARTGESYTAALRHFLPTPPEETVIPQTSLRPAPFRLAVGSLPVHPDPGADAVRRGGELARDRMRQAARAGARLLLLPEGVTCFPDKRVLSSLGPDEVGPSDWTRFAWDALRRELEEIAALAAQLRLWTVFGSTHRLSGEHRPHNSLYVVADDGTVRTRYDERYLSHTKATWMYSPGREPVTFEVDGRRFGCALGIECHFPEAFTQYEALDVDAVLFASTGDADQNAAGFAVECAGHAATNGFWVAFAVPPAREPSGAAGVLAPGGRWLDRCTPDRDVVVVDLATDDPDVDQDILIAVTKARPWRRLVRQSGHGDLLVDDARSTSRTGF